MSKESVEQHPEPTPRGRRQRLKRQFCVRIDEQLHKAAMAKAESDGLRLTDAVEAGLWLYLQQKRGSEMQVQGRFLWSRIPMRLQRLTLRFWIRLSKPDKTALEEALYNIVEKDLWSIPEAEYVAGLERLGASQPEDSVS